MSSGSGGIANLTSFRLPSAPQFGVGNLIKSLSPKGSDPLRRGHEKSIILASPPKGLTPWGIGSEFAVALAFVFASLFIAGCATEEEDHAHSHIVYHHRPENFKVAVLRLDEMHRILTGPESLPPVKTFADLSHSHEHNDDDEHSHHHHSHQDEVISIGIFQEYFDIVRWLPTIAADNDLPKSEWDPINESCKELSRLVQEIESELKSADSNKQSADDRMRALYCDRTKSFETAISELQAKLSVYDAWQKKVVN